MKYRTTLTVLYVYKYIIFLIWYYFHSKLLDYGGRVFEFLHLYQIFIFKNLFINFPLLFFLPRLFRRNFRYDIYCYLLFDRCLISYFLFLLPVYPFLRFFIIFVDIIYSSCSVITMSLKTNHNLSYRLLIFILYIVLYDLQFVIFFSQTKRIHVDLKKKIYKNQYVQDIHKYIVHNKKEKSLLIKLYNKHITEKKYTFVSLF